MTWSVIVLLLLLFGGLLGWGFCTGLTVHLAVARGGPPWKWAWLGLLLGPFGIWLVLRLVRPCPQCARPVLREVLVCPQCAAEIPRRSPEDNPRGPLWSYRRDW